MQQLLEYEGKDPDQDPYVHRAESARTSATEKLFESEYNTAPRDLSCVLPGAQSSHDEGVEVQSDPYWVDSEEVCDEGSATGKMLVNTKKDTATNWVDVVERVNKATESVAVELGEAAGGTGSIRQLPMDEKGTNEWLAVTKRGKRGKE